MGDNKIEVSLITPLSLFLFVLFFISKIFDKIDWSWWWVFSPLWIPLAFVCAFAFTMAFTYLVIIIYAYGKDLFSGRRKISRRRKLNS